VNIGTHQIRCITFDLDDTLWECFPVIIRAEQVFYKWLESNYPTIAKDFDVESLMLHRRQAFSAFPQMVHDFTWLRKIWLRNLVADYGCDTDKVDEGFDVFLKARNAVTLFDGVELLLERVKSHYRCGSITNGNADITMVGIDSYFDFEITAARAGAAKPDPIVFNAAVQASGVPPENILHIGDDPERDVRGASRLGIHTAWINPKDEEWQGDHAPNLTFKNVTEITHLLAGE